MDIHTLSAVITKLEAEVAHCHDMIRWAIDNTRDDKDIDMWCNSKVQAKQAVNMIQAMLDAELAERDNQEAA